ncbi:disulfide bond formation protein B [Roseisalinus antarcticus]|uniref:Disulfide bond formation protein B n=1 Tax=Roseisalinus antarcticus TaxID=254357 RepID=A0A1Y5TGR9_9RHOB|nr:disulfide bond formation protein B [Roseisalinus antarcticus]SLN60052.1 disulfide bond formation protein B [Roseisalinus antarcticus]
MTFRQLVALATLGSMALLGGAFVFQLLGYAPCKLCLWQRWPHAAAIVLGALILTMAPSRILAALGGLAALGTAGIGIYHTGVERGWWMGPTSCTSGGQGLNSLSGDLLLPGNAAVEPVVLCDEVAWELFGLSMASWNASFSLALAVIWVLALTAPRKA